jgi:hypothetical protein
MDDSLYISFTVAILAQAENLQSISNKAMETHQQQSPSMIRSIVFDFMTLAGSVLMTLEDVFKDKEYKWSTIISMIATKEWYKTCKRWKFFFETKQLGPDDVLVSDKERIPITCVKIDPQIIFELSSGEFLVSVSFDKCILCNNVYDNTVVINSAYHEAHKKLKEESKDGYGTYRSKIQPLWCGSYDAPLYVFRDKNGKELNRFDLIEDPGDDNVLIVAEPDEVYCDTCETKFHGPLRIGEQRRGLREKICFCYICNNLHCPSCGLYMGHWFGTPECLASPKYIDS